jgi:hypothetical protein
MKPSTLVKVIQRQSPEQYREAMRLCEPMLKQPAIIPAIHARIKETYPELDRTDESILFAATVYSAYAPATLLGSGIERCPNGIRQEMCKIMQWKDEPTVNYYQRISAAYLKGKAYQAKVESILLEFQQFSVKSQQTELF